MGIRERLQEIAKELGSQRALADAAAVTEARVSQWLAGDIKRFPAEAALNIEGNKGYAARWLVLGKGPKKLVIGVSEPTAAYNTSPAGTGTDAEKLMFIVRTFLESDGLGRDAILAGAKVAQKKRGGARSRRPGSASADG